MLFLLPFALLRVTSGRNWDPLLDNPSFETHCCHVFCYSRSFFLSVPFDPWREFMTIPHSSRTLGIVSGQPRNRYLWFLHPKRNEWKRTTLFLSWERQGRLVTCTCFALDITFSGFVLNWKWMLLDASHLCRNWRANGNRQASMKQTCLFFLWTPKLSNQWNALSKKGNYDHAFEKWSWQVLAGCCCGWTPGADLNPLQLSAAIQIYVYELPRKFNEDWLVDKRCSNHLFAAEVAIHQNLLSSPLRTLNPDEADFFFLPVYVSCKFSPKTGFPSIGHAPRTIHSAVSLVSSAMPYWNRSKGSDHIFVATHDFGACFHSMVWAYGWPTFLFELLVIWCACGHCIWWFYEQH